MCTHTQFSLNKANTYHNFTSLKGAQSSSTDVFTLTPVWRWRNIYYSRLSYIFLFVQRYYQKTLFLLFRLSSSITDKIVVAKSLFCFFLLWQNKHTHIHTQSQSQAFQHKTLPFKRSDFHLNMTFFSGKLLVLSMLYSINVN